MTDRHIPDAADEFRGLMVDLRAMLAAFRHGWLWTLLTVSRDSPPDDPGHQNDRSDA